MNIITLRRILSLNIQLIGYNRQVLWRSHVGANIPLRLDDAIIDRLPYHNPWRHYALINSPKKATKVYETRSPETKIKPKPFVDIRGGFIDYEIRHGVEFVLYTDHRLAIITEIGGEPKVEHSVAKVINTYGKNYELLTTSGDMNINGQIHQLSFGSRVINVGAAHDRYLFLLASGRAVFTDDKYNVLYNVTLPQPILQLSMVTVKYKSTYGLFLLSVDGSLHRPHIMETNGVVQLLPKKEINVENDKIVSYTIARAIFSILLLTETHSCYGWGTNQYNNLGDYDPDRTKEWSVFGIPNKIILDNVLSTDLSQYFSVYVGTSGEVCIAGLLNPKDLSIDTSLRRLVPPTQLSLPAGARVLYGRCTPNLLVLLCE